MSDTPTNFPEPHSAVKTLLSIHLHCERRGDLSLWQHVERLLKLHEIVAKIGPEDE